jgi:3-oxoacyl-[acyl-carrier protein] reductase
MKLKAKNALVHGAGGAVGGAVARAFARDGARVFLAGRTLASLEIVAKNVRAAGGVAETIETDAFDEQAVEQCTASVFEKAGSIDIQFNAVGFESHQGKALTDLPLNEFSFPIETWTKTQFLTARTAARYMLKQRSGVILMLSASPARLAIPLTAGFGVACAAIEGLSRTFAAELGPEGIRVICIRPHRIGETIPAPRTSGSEDPETRELVAWTLLGRLPTLADVANAAAFLASDQANAITATVANLTCGSNVD